MTGSPNAASYPGPSAGVWASRAVGEKKGSKERTQGFEELRQSVLTKKQREEKERKDKRKEDERKFKAAQKARADKQKAERTERMRVRGESLETIETNHQKYLREEREHEEAQAELARLRINSQAAAVLEEDQLEAVLDIGDVLLEKERAEEADRQRRAREEADARHEAEAKAAREAKAMAKEAELKRKREEEQARQRARQYETKKDMAREVRRQREMEETKTAEMRRRRTEERKRVDKYDAWLGQGDILRDEMELMNERREGSAMHQGGRFSGIPDMKVDGIGNQ
uniref:Uncharacterized protein n=1 Tax=Haptolina brevifila TaxID=156173 RepID=A0A7S2JTC1_9EUKA